MNSHKYYFKNDLNKQTFTSSEQFLNLLISILPLVYTDRTCLEISTLSQHWSFMKIPKYLQLGMLERGSLFSLIIGTCKSENLPGLKHIKLDFVSLNLTKLSFENSTHIFNNFCNAQ